MTQVLLAFVGASLVIIVSPGPDTLLVLRNAAAGGRRAAAWTTAGILAGNLAWQAAVVAGLAALVRSSETAYDVLRYLGAAYLVYLGVRSLAGWWRLRDARLPVLVPEPLAPEAGPGTGASQDAVVGRRTAEEAAHPWWSWAQQGLVTNLLNAKLGAFLVAFFPQFVLPGLSRTVGTLVLAAVFLTLAAAWFAVLLLAIGRLGGWIARPRVRRTIGGLSGLVLVAMGALVALGH